MKPVVDPALKRWATGTQSRYVDAVNLHGSGRRAEAALGLATDAVNKALRSLRRRAALQGYAPEGQMVHPVPDPFEVRGVSTLYDRNGGVAAQWVKTRQNDRLAVEAIRVFVESLVEDARGLAPAVAPPSMADDDLLAVYPMGDPHFGMKAWAEETGDNFDLDEAERLTRAAVDRLVSSAPAAATALLLNLGDFFHADNQDNRTRSGHQLDVDTRWQKVMQVGLRAMIYAVQRLLERHRTVIVRNVKGNHDNHSSFALALAMDAYFANEERVAIALTPAAFWYFRFGKVLIGATHGDTCKLANLPGVMACDAAADWGVTAHRYWYFGHVHHDEVKEFPGVKCESFRTLAARDAWHAGQGYRAGRDMRLIVHHREFGEVERHRCDVAMLTAT